MPSGGFESWIPANDRLQTYALNRTTTGIGFTFDLIKIYNTNRHNHINLCDVAIAGNEEHNKSGQMTV
jgi:hypothetical protein